MYANFSEVNRLSQYRLNGNTEVREKRRILNCNTVKLRYHATSLLCHPRYYTTFDRHQLNSIENIFTMPPLTLATMPPLTLATMPHEVQYCSVLTKQ